MSRELKFRAWDKVDNKMVEVDNLDFASGYVNLTQRTHNYELMQYTDLLDEHGIEIFEGDVVKVCDSLTEEPNDIIREVFFENGFFGITGRDNKKDWLCAWNIIKVIGNKYSNPELLK